MKLKTINKIGLFFILLILIIGCKEKTSEKSRNQKWIEDIAYFESEYLNESKTFSKDSISSCKLILSTLKSQIDSLSDNQLILQLSKCVAMANNGHTAIPLGFMDKIPLRFYRFSNGLHVIKTDSDSKEYLGAKILKINSIEIEDVEKKLNPYLSGIDRWKKFKTTIYLSSPEILNGIGLSERDSMMLTLLKAKDTMEITFGTKEMKNNKHESWMDLYPDSTDMGWQYVLKANINKPLYLENMNEGVFYTFIDSEKLAYFSINGHWDKSENFGDKIDEFIAELKTKTDYDVVFDLRYFTGGNYIIPVDLATRPPKIIDTDKKIYLITSNMTFSAGLVTAARIKYYAKDKIVIVGEEVGDNLKFWAERDNYKLPNSEIRIIDADAEHDWQDDNFTLGKSFWVNIFYGVPAKNLNVDKEIKLSFEDYMNGKDPILNWILNHDE
ncbi:hypothetical protein LB467_10505 [Salegentibacter sp. JZCK2]|uniref:hypothetical protein n=1 Tax=Salegentibacter tibetensis TaxID=2873600 RepID=UPI001CCF8D86|nr:hypothetical protein [Salegentibacter tibetensis]MBZ9730117.1 hypothetical protein [Salegentibacter tibetensis]